MQEILNTLTKEEIILRSPIGDETEKILNKLSVWY